MNDVLEILTPLERGIVLGALMSGEAGARRLLGLAAPLEDRCRSALAQLIGASRSERREAIRRLTAELGRPSTTVRLDGVHPSWFGGVDVSRLSPPSAERLVRHVCRQLPFPAAEVEPAGPEPAIVELLGLPLARLHRALRRFALLLLAEVARRAGTRSPRELDELDRLLPEPYPGWLKRAAGGAPAVTDASWALVVEYWASAAGLALGARGRPEEALLVLGSRFALAALLPAWRGPFVLALPAPIGRTLADCEQRESSCTELIRLVLLADKQEQEEGSACADA